MELNTSMYVLSSTPVETVKDNPKNFCLEETELGEGELVSTLEHSYCRVVTDKDRLRCKTLSLNAKISEMDRREESTVGQIHALETEIALLKKDGVAFIEFWRLLYHLSCSDHSILNVVPCCVAFCPHGGAA